MPALIPVAILGFDATIRLALAASLRATAQRQPGYRPVLGLDDARFVVLDADDPEGLALLRTLGRQVDAVRIHARPPDGPDPARVLDLALVLQSLDTMVGQGPVGDATAGAPNKPPMSGASIAAARPERAAEPLSTPEQRAEREARRRRRAAQAGWVAPRALLVDDSDIALHFLRRHLAAYGIECDFARESDRALALLRQQRYGLVLLDLDLGDDSRLDGFALCHQVPQQARLAGGTAPPIVIVSAFQGQVIQVRGTLAGAQAYLGKPLDPLALRAVLQKLVALPAALPLGALAQAGPAPPGR